MLNLHLLEPYSEKYMELEKVRLPDPDPKILELWSYLTGLTPLILVKQGQIAAVTVINS